MKSTIDEFREYVMYANLYREYSKEEEELEIEKRELEIKRDLLEDRLNRLAANEGVQGIKDIHGIDRDAYEETKHDIRGIEIRLRAKQTALKLIVDQQNMLDNLLKESGIGELFEENDNKLINITLDFDNVQVKNKDSITGEFKTVILDNEGRLMESKHNSGGYMFLKIEDTDYYFIVAYTYND